MYITTNYATQIMLLFLVSVIVFGTILSSAVAGVTGTRKNETDCTEEPIEQRVKKADFVFTGTIRDIRQKDSSIESVSVEIKRVFKGAGRLNLLFLSEVQGRFLPLRHKVCTVEGFDKLDICHRSTRQFDTWLFFANPKGGKLFLTSSLTRISLVAIAQAEAAAKGRPYISAKTAYFHHRGSDECLHKQCPFGGQCKKNLLLGFFECRCILECSEEEDEDDNSDDDEDDDGGKGFCGSDGETYRSICLLNKTACISQKEISIAYEGECEDPCAKVTCLYGAQCTRRGLSHECTCKLDDTCSKDSLENNDIENEIDSDDDGSKNGIVCGTDGLEYGNVCELKHKQCIEQRNIRVAHLGYCDPCRSLRCYHGATCIIREGDSASCACQHDCSRVVRKQCGSDGVTYDNMCFMERASCLKQHEITLQHNGPCIVSCHDEECQYGSTCTDGKCTCPVECPTDEEPVCATDGGTYINECELLKYACSRNLPITVAYLGDCEEDDSQDMCNSLTCLYGGKCVVSLTEGENCICSFFCEDARTEVCGSDGRIYANECYMMRAACRKQTNIQSTHMEFCSESQEEFCDGFVVTRNQSTGDELSCTIELIHSCPPNAYCHTIGHEGRCCEGYQVVSGCEMSKYGCCPNQIMAAPGPEHFRCDIDDETACQCNLLGSVEPTCNLETRTCKCKPHVKGPSCDRCEVTYWGFLGMAEGEEGCLACNCNEFGSIRNDCNQMTGRCTCLENVTGEKCDLCSDGTSVTSDRCSTNDLNILLTPFPTSVRILRGSILSDKTRNPTISTKALKITNTTKLFTKRVKVSKPVRELNPNQSAQSTKAFKNKTKTSETTMTRTTITATTTLTTTSLPTTTEDISSTNYGIPYFGGDSFIELKALDNGSRYLSIELEFQSLTYDGLLFYAGHLDPKKRSFISIAIRNGSLEFRYDLGSGSTTLSIPSSIKINYLHKVIAMRQDRNGLLKLDYELKAAGLSPGQMRTLQIGMPLYLGSVPDKSVVRLRNDHVETGFKGCIHSLRIKSSELGYEEYNLTKASSDDIVSDRKIYDFRETCTECTDEMSCNANGNFTFACECSERYYGLKCEEHEEEVVDDVDKLVDLKKRYF